MPYLGHLEVTSSAELRAHDERMYELAPPWREAERRGVVVVVSNPWHLQLDLDAPDAKPNPSVLNLLRGQKVIGDMLEVTSQSGVGKHVYIKLMRPLAAAERIAIQVALGSDPRREMWSLLRELEGVMPSLVLYETEANLPTVRAFLEGK